MSIQCMVWAMKQQVVTDASARHVLLCLANYAGDEGRAAFPSVSTLSVDTGLSERTVRSKLDLLESCGTIVRGNQAIVAAYIERADKRPVCYDIVMTLTDKPGAAVAPRDEAPGANGAATGCNPCSHGVQSTHERGAAIAPNTSFNPSVEPKDYANPSGTPDMFAEPPAKSAPRADKTSKSEAFDATTHLKSIGADDQVAADWLSQRKKLGAIPSLTAIEGIEREAAKARISLTDALRECCERGWRGFKADWYLKNHQTAAAPAQRAGFMTKQERMEAENARNRAEREARRGRQQTVDVTPAPPQPHPMLPNNNIQDVEFRDAR